MRGKKPAATLATLGVTAHERDYDPRNHVIAKDARRLLDCAARLTHTFHDLITIELDDNQPTMNKELEAVRKGVRSAHAQVWGLLGRMLLDWHCTVDGPERGQRE